MHGVTGYLMHGVTGYLMHGVAGHFLPGYALSLLSIIMRLIAERQPHSRLSVRVSCPLQTVTPFVPLVDQSCD